MTDVPLRTDNGSLVDSIVAHLETAIMVGELPAGTRLSEKALAARLGVSRMPTREALRRLEGRRLVLRTHNLGARVASITVKDLDELLSIREGLEGMAARLAAEHMPDADLEELEQVLRQQEERERQGRYSPDFQSPPLDFHLRIARGSGNANLLDMLFGDSFYLLRVFRHRSSALPGRTSNALAEHRAVAAAIAARQPDTAEAAMRAHLRRAHANILDNAGRLSLPGAAPSPRLNG